MLLVSQSIRRDGFPRKIRFVSWRVRTHPLVIICIIIAALTQLPAPTKADCAPLPRFATIGAFGNVIARRPNSFWLPSFPCRKEWFRPSAPD